MLTVQACQHHRLVVMQPNKAKSFPAATVMLVHRRRGKRGTRSEERTDARKAHASKQSCRQWRSRGVLGVLHPTRRKSEGKNLGRKHLELSAKGGGYLLGKSDGESGRRGRPPALNTRPLGRGLGWTSPRSAHSMFAQQRSTALTVSAISTPC